MTVRKTTSHETNAVRRLSQKQHAFWVTTLLFVGMFGLGPGQAYAETTVDSKSMNERHEVCGGWVPLVKQQVDQGLNTASVKTPPAAISSNITVWVAKKIITMDGQIPYATHVAVKDGKIYETGDWETVSGRIKDQPYTVENRFADKIIMPGFIEAHMHALPAGLLWLNTYVGSFDRVNPDGSPGKGAKTFQGVLNKLKTVAEQQKDKKWIVAWGYDPSTFENRKLTVGDLDPITGDKPTMVIDASMHIVYVNSAALKEAGIDSSTDMEGVYKDKKGQPTGELAEMKALGKIMAKLPKVTNEVMSKAYQLTGRLANRVGLTTMTDLAFGMIPGSYEATVATVSAPDFPVRLSLFPLIDLVASSAIQQKGGAGFIRQIMDKNGERLRVAGVKFIVDGSPQGRTALLNWPYYYDGSPNGLPNIQPRVMLEELISLFKAKVPAAIHVNGDASLQEAIQAVGDALAKQPWPDHRTIFEHAPLTSDEQIVAIMNLNASANFFINHVYYYGDEWYTGIIGPSRAKTISPLRSAVRRGMRFSVHSDNPVTPVNPLFAVWIAVNRKTSGGRLLGAEERIDVEDALRAVTIDAAWVLGEDHLKGSISNGKFADFVVLSEDPLSVESDRIREIEVLATVLGGRLHEVPAEEE